MTGLGLVVATLFCLAAVGVFFAGPYDERVFQIMIFFGIALVITTRPD